MLAEGIREEGEVLKDEAPARPESRAGASSTSYCAPKVKLNPVV